MISRQSALKTSNLVLKPVRLYRVRAEIGSLFREMLIVLQRMTGNNTNGAFAL